MMDGCQAHHYIPRTFRSGDKKINFLVSEYLRTPKNCQSSRVFTRIYAVPFQYIPIGVKINNVLLYLLREYVQ